MSTPTLTIAAGASTQVPSGGHQRPDVCDAYRALRAMTRDERIAAMWRGELTTRQLCQWSSRAQHEVPLLAGELAWIVMRTPDWAEASSGLCGEPVLASRPATIPLGTRADSTEVA